MPADLSNLYKFMTSGDHHAAFLHRVAAALQEWAMDARTESSGDAQWVERQEWAVWALKNPLAAATQILPGLATIANDAGFIAADGSIDASDSQIRAAITDALVDRYAGYVPPAS
jgi:hypothetical protein